MYFQSMVMLGPGARPGIWNRWITWWRSLVVRPQAALGSQGAWQVPYYCYNAVFDVYEKALSPLRYQHEYFFASFLQFPSSTFMPHFHHFPSIFHPFPSSLFISCVVLDPLFAVSSPAPRYVASAFASTVLSMAPGSDSDEVRSYTCRWGTRIFGRLAMLPAEASHLRYIRIESCWSCFIRAHKLNESIGAPASVFI